MNEIESDLQRRGWRKDAADVWSYPKRGRQPGDRDEGKAAQPERAPSPALAPSASPEKEGPRKYVVRVTSFRCRLLDEDNLVCKWHVDALRYAGILPSDAPDRTHIQVSQVKVQSVDQEHTRIVISRI